MCVLSVLQQSFCVLLSADCRLPTAASWYFVLPSWTAPESPSAAIPGPRAITTAPAPVCESWCTDTAIVSARAPLAHRKKQWYDMMMIWYYNSYEIIYLTCYKVGTLRKNALLWRFLIYLLWWWYHIRIVSGLSLETLRNIWNIIIFLF